MTENKNTTTLGFEIPVAVENNYSRLKIKSMEYDVNFFINKFEAIPENKWCVRQWRSFMGQYCAQWHCMTDKTITYLTKKSIILDNGPYYKPTEKETNTILAEVKALTKIFGKSNTYIADINNGDDPEYQQDTPKKRILAKLYDIKKLQEPQVKVKTVYVSVPTTITDQAKETILS